MSKSKSESSIVALRIAADVLKSAYPQVTSPATLEELLNSAAKGRANSLSGTPPGSNAKRYLPYADARAYTGLSRITLWRLSKGKLPVVKIGRRCLFDVHDLDRLLKYAWTG